MQVFKDYFGELDEESIRDNFVIIYELMDEVRRHPGRRFRPPPLAARSPLDGLVRFVARAE